MATAGRASRSYLHVFKVFSLVRKDVDPGDDGDEDWLKIAGKTSRRVVLIKQRFGLVVRESVLQGQLHVVQTGSRTVLWDMNVGPVGGEESQRRQAGAVDVGHSGAGEFRVERNVAVYADLKQTSSI